MFVKCGAEEYRGNDSAAALVAIALPPIHDERPFFLRLAVAGVSLGHAGASLAGKDSSDASATGSNTGDVLCSAFGILGFFFVLTRDLSMLVGSALAPGMSATAVDVRCVLYCFTLRAAIAAALGCQA
jgi:hypothetical protein